MDTRKTLLELHFSKNLQYKNTTILIFYSYLIAVFISFLSGQLDLRNSLDVFIVGIISFAFVNIVIIFWKKFDLHLRNILMELKKL